VNGKSTFREDFAWFVKETGETPTHIAFGTMDGWPDDNWPGIKPGELIAFDAIPDSVLDRIYGTSFGVQECPSYYAWSENWVAVLSEYDGATSMVIIPRHPVAGEVEHV